MNEKEIANFGFNIANLTMLCYNLHTKTNVREVFFVKIATQLISDIDHPHSSLDMNFRYVETQQNLTDSNSLISLHSHNHYELIYCSYVVDVEYLVGSDRYRLQKGDIIVIPPGISHRPLLPERLQAPYRRVLVWLSQEYLYQLQNLGLPSPQFPIRPQLLRTAGTRWEYLGDLFQEGVSEAEKKAPGWEVALYGNTAQIMAHLYRAFQDQSALPPLAEKPQLMDQVLEYIEANLASRITLADAAKHFFVSQSTITQTFRNKMGVSFYRCVTQRRLIAAKRLIEQEQPLESISMQVGFKDYSSFYRAFKQEYGISPRQYRSIHVTSQK